MGEELLEECKIGWLSVENDFSARLNKPELLKYALQVLGRNPSDGAIERYWAQAGGSLSYEQFSLVMRREKKTATSDLMQAFRRIDRNGDGFITTQELQRVLTKRGENMTINEVQAIIAEADLNGDGKLDYAEFCCMLANTTNQCVQASRQKWSQVLKPGRGSNQWSPLSGDTRKKQHEQRRQEIRMYLNSAESNSMPTDRSRLPTSSGKIYSNLPKLDPMETNCEVQSHSESNVVPASTGEKPILRELQGKLSHLQPHLQPHSSVEDPVEGTKVVVVEHHEQLGNHVEETGSSHMTRQTDHLIGNGQPLFPAEAQSDEMPLDSKEVGSPLSEGEEEPLPSNNVKEDEALGGKMPTQDDGNRGVTGAERTGHGVSVNSPVQELFPSSIITPPPRKPNNTETWNSITGKGCFYFENEEEEGEMKSHRYHLVLPAPTNVWVEIGVASPGVEQADVLLLIFRTNEEEEITDIVTYTQHIVGDRWICRMDLDGGTYALIPFTTGCHLELQEEDVGKSHVTLTTSKEGVMALTPECLQVLEEVFHRVDLDNNGYISRTEFDFFQEVTSGEVCDDDAWNIILSNFDVTDEEEITLKGFIGLHEMAAADEEGGEEELRQVISGMGYDKQLRLSQALPFSFEVLTEDCEGEIEIVDLLPFSTLTNPAFTMLAMERGVSAPVAGEETLATHIFTTPHMTTLVVENKSSEVIYVQLDCSQSENCIMSRNSAVHVMKVAANSSFIGYYFRPADQSEPHRVYCTASKILV